MIFFNNVAPRRFSLRPVFSDERKERLRVVEERARRELGMPKEAIGNKTDIPNCTREKSKAAITMQKRNGPDMRESSHGGRLHGAFTRHNDRRLQAPWLSHSSATWLLAAILVALIYLLANTDTGHEILIILTT